ncbi:M23 family metallopeptidase [Mycetocola manganoxydans]|uniref:M23 family metallopeptidase n=2 Tax=Mycetocola manganoxydans TaxID=699879 RepID=A0A3L6ZUS6_9MICO|nr:M23 family metallopeptidase [Mycetocola manganoxydans]
MPSGTVHVAVTLVAVAVLVLGGPAPAAGEKAAPPPRVEPSPWEWPTPPPHQLLRPFEAPPTPYSAGHRGIDVPAVTGGAVVAAADGVVSFSGIVVDRPVLSVRHDGGLVSSIEPVAATVAAGDVVLAGDRVGVVGSGGHCDERCVHFGVRLHGEYVNPLALLTSVQRAVLLPLGR